MRMRLGSRPGKCVGSRESADCIECWKSGEPYWFNTQRLSGLKLEIEDSDILALFYGLVERYEKLEATADAIKVVAEANSRVADCLRAMCSRSRSKPRP